MFSSRPTVNEGVHTFPLALPLPPSLRFPIASPFDHACSRVPGSVAVASLLSLAALRIELCLSDAGEMPAETTRLLPLDPVD